MESSYKIIIFNVTTIMHSLIYQIHRSCCKDKSQATLEENKKFKNNQGNIPIIEKTISKEEKVTL